MSVSFFSCIVSNYSRQMIVFLLIKIFKYLLFQLLLIIGGCHKRGEGMEEDEQKRWRQVEVIVSSFFTLTRPSQRICISNSNREKGIKSQARNFQMSRYQLNSIQYRDVLKLQAGFLGWWNKGRILFFWPTYQLILGKDRARDMK